MEEAMDQMEAARNRTNSLFMVYIYLDRGWITSLELKLTL